ncbi:MAG: DEAD/DEAH box helicase [Proteobacteria bacterium]|nr:DEAD/DEAH box helicase [Pseudomonadota bacterium]MBU1596649.1 DEAD/DEAH box helicase [Pseudomonadota bacterium]
MTFESFGFPSLLLSNIKAMGYTAPTPIQSQAMPAVMQGRDLMGLAQTGTGKTAAFLLPILTRLVNNKPTGPRRKVRALILAPTRELAEQIHEAAMDLGRGTGIRSTTIYGGCAMSRQLSALRQGTDIVVACPGRLLDHMGQRTIDLSGVEVLVLDEGDQMFDMGFLPGIKKILAALPRQRQTLLFSATMPDAIRGLAAECLTEPETVRVGNSNPVETVSHAIYPVGQHLKTRLLQELLDRNKSGSVLVFTRTKHRAKRLAETLAKGGLSATSIQGNLSQAQRKIAMDGFRAGRYRVLVATDIAARGIDVSQIEHVVNYDVPSTPETYTHRIGRTGRASRTGEAHTFVTGEDVSMVRAIERLLREPLARKKLEGFDYNASVPAGEREFQRPPLEPRARAYDRPQAARPSRPYRPSGHSDRSASEGYTSHPAQPGDNIYASDRPAGDRPRSDRPAYGRPQGNRPLGPRVQGSRPQGGTGYSSGNR